MAKILLVRHGISEFNTARKFAGYSNVEMSAEGYLQVQRLRDRLAAEKIDAVYCSDLKRARVTAEVISSLHKSAIIECPELREINYGDCEGLTFKEISNRYADVGDNIANFNLGLSFPGGESFTQFINRTVTFVKRLEKHGQSETVLVVSHNGPLVVLVCHLLGIDQSHWRQIRISNASLSILETYPQGAVLSLLNDISHLKAGA